MISLRLPKHLQNRLKRLSEATGRTQTYYVVKALSNYLDHNETKLLEMADIHQQAFSSPEIRKKIIDLAGSKSSPS